MTQINQTEKCNFTKTMNFGLIVKKFKVLAIFMFLLFGCFEKEIFSQGGL